MSDQGFPRNARLLSAADYKRVFDRASRSADALFTVLACANHHRPARLGLAISKKHVRRSVQRNRLKRLAREVFRRRRAELRGIDLVIMARPKAAGATNEAITGSLVRHLQNLRETVCVS